jgi:hypothetical protein
MNRTFRYINIDQHRNRTFRFINHI